MARVSEAVTVNITAIRTIPIAPTPRGYAIAKRTLDITASSVGLLVASPVMAAVAAAIKASSPGPVFFRQERVGLGGRHFMCFKFRTMRDDADEAAHQRHISRLMRQDRPAGRERTWIPIAEDNRVTRVGGFLRRSHLDELPQLINVLRGDMSIVGPRPPIPYEVELYEPRHLGRLAVVPGLTGLWQAMGWGKLSFDEGVALDLEYIKRRSFWLDLRLIWRTLFQIATGRQF